MDSLGSQNAVILLAEDDDNDVALFRRAIAKAAIPNPMHVVGDGEQVIAYLKGEGAYSNRSEYPLPTLLLLDLKMPRMDGFEALEWIREQPELKALCVVVLTTSTDIYDVNRAYKSGANSFLVKSLDIQSFAKLVAQIRHYWLCLSLPPQIRRPPRREGPPVASRARILVVDDEAAIRELLRETLLSAGFDVLLAWDGVEGARLCRSKRIDLMIVDIFMPRKDGLETLMEIRGYSPAAKVLAISGGARRGLTQALKWAEKLGAADILTKPFTAQELLERVTKILEKTTATHP